VRSGTLIRGTLTQGLKRPKNAQNTITHSGQILPRNNTIIYVWRPKNHSRSKRPKSTLGPRPNTTVRPLRGLTSREANSASLEGSPLRPLEAQAISTSPKAPSAEPSARPRRRGTPPRSRPPRQTGAAAQPPDGTDTFTANHSADGSRGQTASAARHTTDVTGAPSPALVTVPLFPARCGSAENCANKSDTAPPLCRPLLVLSPLQDPWQAWAATLDCGTALDWDKAALRQHLRRSAPSTQSTACLHSNRHAADWCHRARTRPGYGQKASQDDDHTRRHAPHCPVSWAFNCSPPIQGEGYESRDLPHM